MNLLTILLLNKFAHKKGGVTPTGTINITENGTHDVTNYAEANVNVVSDMNAKVALEITQSKYINSLIQKLPSPLTFDSNDVSSAFQNCYLLEEIPELLHPTRKFHNMASMFYHCDSIKTISLYDTSEVTSLAGTFEYCKNIQSLPQYNTPLVSSMREMCRYCYKLENVPILDTSSCTTLQNAFGSCPLLSNESLNNIMRMCINSAQSSNKTLTYIGLSADQKTTCQTLSNYQDFIDAGWTA